MNGKEEFIQIRPESFLSGMFVASDVFYIKDNKPVLFCEHSVITDYKIGKLKEVADENAPIFITKSSFDLLAAQYPHFRDVNKVREKTYRETKKKFFCQAEEARLKNRIDLDDTNEVLAMLEQTLDQIELSFVMQWISYMRDSDEYLCTHSVNVGMLSGLIGMWVGYSEDERKRLILAGLLHDIGKTRIDDKIINAPKRLSAEEFAEIKKHPLFSYDIMKNSGMEDEDVLNAILGHHEKGNGTGYPFGLNFDQISQFAKIISIADIYDAMVAKRVYKDAKSPFVVLDEFYKNKFSDLDIRLVDVFLERMASEMIGKKAVLSDGRIAEIVFVEKTNFLYPVVSCNGKIFKTTSKITCESLCLNLV